MTSNNEQMRYKKVKETTAEKLLKKNYDATVAYLQAMKLKNERENGAKSRAKRKTDELRSTGSTNYRELNKSSRS